MVTMKCRSKYSGKHFWFVSFGTILLLTIIKNCYANNHNRYSQKFKKAYRRQIQENVFQKNDVGTDASSRQTACTLNVNGYYGTIELTSDIYDIQYLYQVSVVVGTTEVQLRDDIILPLETVTTTAILPTFFSECNNNRRYNKRSLQNGAGVITAISSTPDDTIVMSGLTCSKTIPNTDCYVIQGINTVIATDFPDKNSVEILVQAAVQSVFQNNAIVPILGSSLVVDVTSLTDDLAVAPPISTIPQAIPVAPISAPVNTGTSVPTTVEPPVLTFAPIPDLLPPAPFFFGPSIPTILLPPSSSTSPTTTSGRPVTSDSPSAVPIAAAPVSINTPVLSPDLDNSDDRDQQSTSSKDGLKWWVWLLISLGTVTIAFCSYGAYLNQKEGSSVTKTSAGGGSSLGGNGNGGSSANGILSSNSANKSSKRVVGNFSNRKTTQKQDAHDTEDDDEVVPYEPPPGMDLYHPPTAAPITTSNFPNDNINGSIISFDTNNIDSTTPLMTTPVLFTNNAASTPVVTPPPVFVNNAGLHDDEDDDDDEEEEEEEEEEDEEVQYEREDEGDYMVEGEDDDDEEYEEEEEEQGYITHHQQHHEDGEVFEDEESYYEDDEEEEEEEGVPFDDGQNHGFQQSPFGTMY